MLGMSRTFCAFLNSHIPLKGLSEGKSGGSKPKPGFDRVYGIMQIPKIYQFHVWWRSVASALSPVSKYGECGSPVLNGCRWSGPSLI
jgi:hypothetical protein